MGGDEAGFGRRVMRGQFHVAVAAMFLTLAGAMAGFRERGKEKMGDGVLRCEFANLLKGSGGSFRIQYGA